MIKKIILIITSSFLLISLNSYGHFQELKFSSKKHELLYRKLTNELKCLVCQNQSLAESDAELALQLREEIYKKVEKGQSREQILKYITERYGEFILLKPEFSRKNLLLWLAPVIFLLFGLALIRKKLK